MVKATNDSGFHGYAASSLYPGMFSGVTQTLETVPEPAEQEALANIDQPAPKAVDRGMAQNIWILIGGIVLLVVLFGR